MCGRNLIVSGELVTVYCIRAVGWLQGLREVRLAIPRYILDIEGKPNPAARCRTCPENASLTRSVIRRFPRDTKQQERYG